MVVTFSFIDFKRFWVSDAHFYTAGQDIKIDVSDYSLFSNRDRDPLYLADLFWKDFHDFTQLDTYTGTGNGKILSYC